ncbi:GlsB/YeaQ/YmgE family stress response membrane protein [Ruegeria arenilitoris]|uniref:GlsB/YeaQ/YmgE family stress response membrane protein n=1 Tax=Ruegeria arenilitoris TaxID=1173585 RepID=UPI001CFDF644|nr:GlsB/YeaQ/YmgE family stress response membrane protein [Ruegeria arenilitoris]
MTRLMTVSTTLGLIGLALAMLTALTGGPSTIVALGFVMLALGFMGAVAGAAAVLGRVWESAR